MIQWLFDTLKQYPEIAIFLALSLGYYFGKFTFKGIGLCDKHWSEACQDGSTTQDYLRENLVEDAILAIDWS